VPGLVPFRPNPTQAAFVYSPHTFTAMYGGVGDGKSSAGCIKILMLADLFPGNNLLVGRLTYPELRDTTMKDVLDVVRERNGGTLEPGPYVVSWNKTTLDLVVKGGSQIHFRYLENYESILSMNLGGFWVDQAEFIPEETYLALESRLRFWGPSKRSDPKTPTFKERWVAQYKRTYRRDPPALPREFGFITGNPGPGWVYERYKRNPSGLYHMYEAATSENAANLPDGYEERLRASYSEDYQRRFIDGDWSLLAGAIYKTFSRSTHVVRPEETDFWVTEKDGQPIEPHLSLPAYYPRFISWDHGQRNPTSVHVSAADEDGNLIFYLEHYRSSEILSDHADAVKLMVADEPVQRGENGELLVWMDPSVAGTSDPRTGRDFRQMYLDFGIAGLVANKSVNAGIGKVAYMLNPDPTHLYPRWHPKRGQPGSPRLFIIDGRCPALVMEFPQYRWESRKPGSDVNEPEKPHKYMDHAMDDIRYNVMAYFDEKAKRPEQPKDQTYGEWVHQQMLQN
jgi:hypothetical protein